MCLANNSQACPLKCGVKGISKEEVKDCMLVFYAVKMHLFRCNGQCLRIVRSFLFFQVNSTKMEPPTEYSYLA